MRRILITGVVVTACLYNPVSAQIVCGDQPKITPTSSAEGFKADASGKAQLFSKVLPSAEISGKVDQYKTEQRQQYKDLDQHELSFYWVWVSCQMIATSKEMTAAQKTEQWNKVHAAFITPPQQPAPAEPPRESAFIAIDGIWRGVSNKSAVTVSLHTGPVQPDLCRPVSGTMTDNSGDSSATNVDGSFCPGKSTIDFRRKLNEVVCQNYTGGVFNSRIEGTFTVAGDCGGSQGTYPFWLTN